MKTLDEIKKLGPEDLERIGRDPSIPVPEQLNVKLKQPERAWQIAAAAALLIGAGVAGALGAREPRDTFKDPYMAYAAAEKALERIGETLQEGADKIAESKASLDKISYWK